MARWHEVRLEIVRPGPAHNQLLSPLTAYQALCGEGSPVTFHVGFEHHALLQRLERLRYVSDAAGVPERVRSATVTELGHDMAALLAEIRSLLAELTRARGCAECGPEAGPPPLVHLRLVLGGSELAFLPFELALAPQAMPGEGLEACLQLALPLVPTRETRSSRPRPVSWNTPHEPRVLLVAAAPEGRQVPLEAHVHALAAAVEPWVKWPAGAPDDASARVKLYRERLSVLPNASWDTLYARCAAENFTHVHVLAHGAALDVAGERRYGIALCQPGDATRADVVSGQRLAQALQAESRDGARRSTPLVVTLMTCDAGQTGSVLAPGGSVAHELHTAGIPWVLASQFPLTVSGSVRLTDDLYPRLLRGDDPRQALYEVRRKLYLGAQRDHDWASLVAYAALPDDFDQQVIAFMGRQARAALDVGLERCDAATDDDQRGRALQRVREQLDGWRARLPTGTDAMARASRAECYGIHGASYKRLALLHANDQKSERESLLRDALRFYRLAMDEWDTERLQQHHWVTTQVLSLQAVLGDGPDAGGLAVARQLAQRALASADRGQQAWAHSTLAELALLAGHHDPAAQPAPPRSESVAAHCRALVALMGPGSFHVASTRRQFERYARVWTRDTWREAAQAAIAALTNA